MEGKVKTVRRRLGKFVVLTIKIEDGCLTDSLLRRIMWDNNVVPVGVADLGTIDRLRSSGKFKSKDLIAAGCLGRGPSDSGSFAGHHRFREDGTRDVVDDWTGGQNGDQWANGTNFVFLPDK